MINILKNIANKFQQHKKTFLTQNRKNKFSGSLQQQQSLIMDPEKPKVIPTQMQVKHVYDVYDRIAPHFSHTRYKPWPKIQKFLNELPSGSLVFDIGCGNGKYLGVNNELYMIGTDRSLGLLETASEKSQTYQLFAADSLKLPLRSGFCDAFICIAVIHHFSNEQIRKKAIEQMIRITKIGGQGLIYVWAFQHGQESVSKKKFTEQDLFVPWHLQFKYEKDLDTMDLTDAKVDLQKKTVVYNRYYHVFKEGQLGNLIKEYKNVKILEQFYDKENWACRVQRIF